MDTVNYRVKGPVENRVEAWAKKRLQYDPKDWRKDFRNALREAIPKISCSNESILYTGYSSPIFESCDIENVLIYNVQPTYFKTLCKTGILIERIKDCFMPVCTGFTHYHIYKTVPRDHQSISWKQSRPLAEWRNVRCPPLMNDIKAYQIWYAMKTGNVSHYGRLNQGKFFGVELTLETPSIVNCAQFIKPVIDGMLCSFHTLDNKSQQPIVIDRIRNVLDLNPDSIKDLLTDTTSGVLGPRKMVYLRGKGLQWSPADDSCMVIKLIVKSNKLISKWSLSGKLFEVE